MTRVGGQTWRYGPALAIPWALAACEAAPATRQKQDQGTPLLRVIYRDADAEMVLMVPEKGARAALHGDCAAPLLIDTRTGAVRVLDEAEVQARLRTMQLAGATRGACPR
ncbi:hypothetical protein [Novosphingobium sp.]|uniref:hypothetical protein n=1 Tax=Novosphingobium sp. TaxID=1874826 RepID=UPI00262FCCBF|nr:hypothetical protein [Novosphingobium sp.]